MVFKDIQQLDFNRRSCIIQDKSNTKKSLPVYPPFKSSVEYLLCLVVVFEYRVHVLYLIKMSVLNYTPCKEHFEVYTEIYWPIAVKSCQIEPLITENIATKSRLEKDATSADPK